MVQAAKKTPEQLPMKGEEHRTASMMKERREETGRRKEGREEAGCGEEEDW